MPKFDFEVNFSVQSYASLSHEDPAYLQITYYIYYLKYTELKSYLDTEFGRPNRIPASKSLWPRLSEGIVFTLNVLNDYITIISINPVHKDFRSSGAILPKIHNICKNLFNRQFTYRR